MIIKYGYYGGKQEKPLIVKFNNKKTCKNRLIILLIKDNC